MNRLWIRLSLAFAAVIIIAMFVLGLAVRRAAVFGDLSEGEVPVEVREYVQRLREEGPPYEMTPVLIIVGTIVIVAGAWMSRSLTAPLNELGQAAQAIGEQDLSQRVTVTGTEEIRAVASRFNQMAEHLEREELLRRNLLADVAHELRHPLHILQGNLQAILDGVYPMTPEEIARLLDQTHDLTALVNDLHELAQAEARQLPLHIREVELASFVKDTAVAYKALAAEKGIDLRVELLGTLSSLQMDPARIRQALNNLISNALDHTPSGGRICVSVEQHTDGCEIQVRDTGEGIDELQLPTVFDRFYRTDSVRGRDSGGTGLGLSIVKAITEAHGGRVVVSSPGFDQGSTFTMILPAL